MRAAVFNKYLTFQIKEESTDNYGEVDITWIDDFDIWGDIKPIRGNEYYTAQQIQSSITHKITTRYCTLSDGNRIKSSNCRIIFDDRIFDIQSIININERNITLEFMVVEEL